MRSCRMPCLANKMKTFALHCRAVSRNPYAGNCTLQRPRVIACAGLWDSGWNGQSQRAVSKSTGIPLPQAKQLQRVQMELLAVRESLHPLQKKQHRELLKDEPNLIQLDHLVEAIKPLAAVEQQLLRERERLETQSRSERRRLEAQGEGVMPVQPSADMAAGSPVHSMTESSNAPVSRQRLFVVIPRAVSEDMVTRLFQSFPGMEYCDLKRDRVTGQSKGFAYVNYRTAHAAAAAVEQLNGLKFPPHSGRPLKVMFAEEPFTPRA